MSKTFKHLFLIAVLTVGAVAVQGLTSLEARRGSITFVFGGVPGVQQTEVSPS